MLSALARISAAETLLHPRGCAMRARFRRSDADRLAAGPHGERNLAVFWRTELDLVVLEIGGKRFGRGRIDGAGLRRLELDVVDRTLLVLEADNGIQHQLWRLDPGRDRASDLPAQRDAALFGDVALLGVTGLAYHRCEAGRIELAVEALEVRIVVNHAQGLGVGLAEPHGGIANKVKVNLDWIESEVFEHEDPTPFLEHVNGILVPGGFGQRGAEGKIRAARFARERDVPYFGICFGMLFITRILAGIGSGGVFPVSLSLVSDLVGPDKRQVAIGRTLAGSMAGNLLGATLSGLIGDFLGWRGVLALLGVLVIGSSIAVGAGFRGAALARPPRANFAAIRQGYRTIFSNPNAKFCYGAVFIEGCCVLGLFPYVASFLFELGEVRLSIAGIVIAGFAVGGLFYTLTVSRFLPLLGMKNLSTLLARRLILANAKVDLLSAY